MICSGLEDGANLIILGAIVDLGMAHKKPRGTTEMGGGGFRSFYDHDTRISKNFPIAQLAGISKKLSSWSVDRRPSPKNTHRSDEIFSVDVKIETSLQLALGKRLTLFLPPRDRWHERNKYVKGEADIRVIHNESKHA